MDTPYVAILVPVAGSTQQEARRRFDGTPVLVRAERQTAGRGRTGSAWVQADRAVAVSLAFEPAWPADTWPRLTLVAGLAARSAAGDRVRLAWPNDLVVAARKVGGLITEAAGSLVIVGFGLNLFWPDPIPGAGALFADDPGDAAAGRIAEAWAQDLLRRIEAGPRQWGIEDYRSASATIGREISWEPQGSGVAIDVDDDGALLVENADGRTRLDSGAVRRVRPT